MTLEDVVALRRARCGLDGLTNNVQRLDNLNQRRLQLIMRIIVKHCVPPVGSGRAVTVNQEGLDRAKEIHFRDP